MLFKGIEEAKEATQPLAAADMVLVRIAHAADLPTPDEALRALKDGGPARDAPSCRPRPRGRWAATAGRALRPPAAVRRGPKRPRGRRHHLRRRNPEFGSRPSTTWSRLPARSGT